jgi:hypothetical protein
MGFLDFLSGASEIGGAQGFDINKEDFKIKDADKLFGQTQTQYEQNAARSAALQPKQEAFLNTLEQSAMGRGPSIAVEAMKQSQERNLAQQLAAAQAQRGGNPALMQRELLRAQQQGSQDIAQAGGIAKLQEQQGAQQIYGKQLQDQQSMVNNLTQQYLAQGFGIRQAEQQALADYNKLQVDQALGLAQINAQNQQKRADLSGGMIGSVIGGIASGGASLLAKGGAAKAGGGTDPMAAFKQLQQNPYPKKTTLPS